MKTFLDGRVTLWGGDCLSVVKAMADNSIDSCVTDPPYALVSVIQRFGKSPRSETTENMTNPYGRTGRGFMGKTWDTGETAFAVEFWTEVLRVLKPGGHVAAFGGTRTYHQLAYAIEASGFEIRDAIMWHFGVGFPKSHDVSKGIDKRGGVNVNWFGPWLKSWRTENNIAQKDVAALFPSKTGGKTGCVANWELGLGLPTVEQFNLICLTFDLPFASMAEAEREIVGQQNGNLLAVAPGQDNDRSAVTLDITAPATDAARQWEGWGTALKPATEIICLARKPLSEKTVAANVLRWGTGAINVGACKIEATDKGPILKSFKPDARHEGYARPWMDGRPLESRTTEGRWPANLCLSWPDDEYELRPDITKAQLHELSGWFRENA